MLEHKFQQEGVKVRLEYHELLVIARTAARLISTLTNPQLVAVSRGGLTFAQAVAYYRAAELHFFIPKIEQVWPQVEGGTLVFLEDVLATGRTYQTCKEYASRIGLPFLFLPAVTDHKCVGRFSAVGQLLVSKSWVVFPHEDLNQVEVGDRGLFREKTSVNSKPLL